MIQLAVLVEEVVPVHVCAAIDEDLLSTPDEELSRVIVIQQVAAGIVLPQHF